MNNLGIFIMIGAGVFVLGSLLWVLPSPRERGQMRLRRKAMSLGIQVQLSKIDDPYTPGELYRCCAYRRQREKHEQPLVEGVFYRQIGEDNQDQSWRIKNNPRLAIDKDFNKKLSVLDELPSDCKVVESNQAMVAIYWQERGSETDVATISRTLGRL